LSLAPGEQLGGPMVDRGHADVDELDIGLLGQNAGDVVLEAEPKADERLAEELALLLLLERPVEVLVRDEPLAQQERSEVGAGLVVEETVVETCGPRVQVGIGRSPCPLERKSGIRRIQAGIGRRESMSSAIWIPFSAAPLRRLSQARKSESPFSAAESTRIRPTRASSPPAAWPGVGNSSMR